MHFCAMLIFPGVSSVMGIGLLTGQGVIAQGPMTTSKCPNEVRRSCLGLLRGSTARPQCTEMKNKIKNPAITGAITICIIPAITALSIQKYLRHSRSASTVASHAE